MGKSQHGELLQFILRYYSYFKSWKLAIATAYDNAYAAAW